MKLKSVRDCLDSEDPLSDAVFEFLLGYREEDSLVDFKESFDESEREWLEITKDVMSFANFRGGYLLFGVRDRTFDRVGVTPQLETVLTDTNNILQKLNRFLDPSLGGVRAKPYESAGLRFAAWFAPESIGKTHVVSRNGVFKFPSGQERVVLREGTIWVRRSAGNHLAEASDIEDIFGRRNERFRESLLSKIARVVDAPPETEVFVLSPDPTDNEGKRFTITDAPEALEIKGMSFSVAPATDEQELAGWIAMSQRDPNAIPAPDRLWSWYANREQVGFSADHRLHLAEFCLLTDVPAFYWLKDLDAEPIKEVLRHAASRRRPGAHLASLIGTAAFLGRRFHGSIVKQLGDQAERLSQRYRVFPSSGPAELMGNSLIEGRRGGRSKLSGGDLRAKVLDQLNIIAEDARDRTRQPGVLKRSQAIAFDCFLYAQSDQYARRRGETRVQGDA